MALNGQMLNEAEVQAQTPVMEHFHGAENLGNVDIKYGYCTEFIVKLHNPEKFNESFMKNPLSQMGDSLVVVTDDDLLKIHVHTNQPGVALTLAQKYGDLQTMKIENMRLQHSTIMNVEATQPNKVEKAKAKFGIIAVASGEGIHEAFKELGVHTIIDGGQTMNPSTEAFVKAVEELNAEHIIILPNNKNIVLSAEQTIDLCQDRSIRVLKTKSIAQGYSSLMAFDPTQELDINIEEMSAIVSNMRSAEITYAVRDTEINGVKIKNGDFIGITKGEILVSTPSRIETAHKLLDDMINEDREIITIFHGVDATEEEVLAVVEYAKKLNPDIEVDLISGKQELFEKLIVCLKIATAHPQVVICVSAGCEAIENFISSQDCIQKVIHDIDAVTGQSDMNNRMEAQTTSLGAENRRIAFDHFRVFQSFHAPPTCGIRHCRGFRQFLIGDPAIGLQRSQQRFVCITNQ